MSSHTRNYSNQNDEWNRLQQIQSQQVKQHETYEQEQQRLRQEKYRQYLQETLDHKQDHKAVERERERQFLEMNKQKQQLEEQAKFEKQQQLKQANEQCLNLNQLQIQNKLDQEARQKQQDFEYQQHNLEREKKLLEEQRQAKEQQKKFIIDDLHRAFTSQQEMKQQFKNQEKQKEFYYADQENKRLYDQERKRKDFFEKLKNGYHTHDSMVEYYQKLYDQKDAKEKDFIRNQVEKAMAERNQRMNEEDYNKRMNIIKMNKQTNDILERQIQQKDDLKKFEQEQKQLQYQQMQKSLQIAENQRLEQMERQKLHKQSYITDLQKQMQDEDFRRKNPQGMNQYEFSVNKNQLNNQSNINVPIVPALAENNDVHRKRQLYYIDKQLGLKQGNFNFEEEQRHKTSIQKAAMQSINPQDMANIGRVPSNRYQKGSDLLNHQGNNQELVSRDLERQRQEDMIREATQNNTRIGRVPSNALYANSGGMPIGNAAGKNTGQKSNQYNIIGQSNQLNDQKQQLNYQNQNQYNNNSRPPSEPKNSHNYLLKKQQEPLSYEEERRKQAQIIQQAYEQQHQNNQQANVGRAPNTALQKSSGILNNAYDEQYNQKQANNNQNRNNENDKQNNDYYNSNDNNSYNPNNNYKNEEMLGYEEEKQRQARLIQEATKKQTNIGRNPAYGHQKSSGVMPIGNYNNESKNNLNSQKYGNQRQQNEMNVYEDEKKRQAELIQQATLQNRNIGRKPQNSHYQSSGAMPVGNHNYSQQQQQQQQEIGRDQQYSRDKTMQRQKQQEEYLQQQQSSNRNYQGVDPKNEMNVYEQEKIRQAEQIQQATQKAANIGRNPSYALQKSSGVMPMGNYENDNDNQRNQNRQNQNQFGQKNEMLSYEEEKKRQAELISQATKNASNIGRAPKYGLQQSSGVMPVGNVSDNYGNNNSNRQDIIDNQNQYDAHHQQDNYIQSNNQKYGNNYGNNFNQQQPDQQSQKNNIGRGPSNKNQQSSFAIGGPQNFQNEREMEKKRQAEILASYQAQQQGSNIGRGPSNKQQGSQAQGSVF